MLDADAHRRRRVDYPLRLASDCPVPAVAAAVLRLCQRRVLARFGCSVGCRWVAGFRRPRMCARREPSGLRAKSWRCRCRSLRGKRLLTLVQTGNGSSRTAMRRFSNCWCVLWLACARPPLYRCNAQPLTPQYPLTDAEACERREVDSRADRSRTVRWNRSQHVPANYD
jgi:hypothetical protein